MAARLPGLFSPRLIYQSSCRILTSHIKTMPILHDDWLDKLGENRPDRALKHLAPMTFKVNFIVFGMILYQLPGIPSKLVITLV